MPDHDLSELPSALDDLDLILEASRTASMIAMDYFQRPTMAVDYKNGTSPVSEGDFAVDRHLHETLMAARPDYGWLSEETTDSDKPVRMNAKRSFIVDPIDGTRAYIGGRDMWCVSIAVVEDGQPIVGVLACPALGKTYWARRAHGAWLDGKRLAAATDITPVNALAGRDQLVRAVNEATGRRFEIPPHIPSLAYRMALVADGTMAGTFVRDGCHDWDIAAAMLIVSETGQKVTGPDGQAIALNGLTVKKPPLVVAHPEIHPAMVAVAGR